MGSGGAPSEQVVALQLGEGAPAGRDPPGKVKSLARWGPLLRPAASRNPGPADSYWRRPEDDPRDKQGLITVNLVFRMTNTLHRQAEAESINLKKAGARDNSAGSCPKHAQLGVCGVTPREETGTWG